MHYSFDRTGFPYVELPDLGLAVSLLPLTKLQLERYLADLTPQGDRWYEELLKLNPRVSPTRFGPDERERLFATGILPEEAQAFAAWLGEGYRLPTVSEWRDVYQQFKSLAFAPVVNSSAIDDRAATLLHRMHEHTLPQTLLDLSLMLGGVVEWVREGKTWTGLGAPRPQLKPNLWNPLREIVTPVNLKERIAYFGARLMCDIRNRP